MRIVVLGAAGRTGREVVGAALRAGHEVIAFVRSAEGAPLAPGVQVLVGDATKQGDVETAIRDADAVISALGAAKGSVITDSLRRVRAAAEVTGLKRVTVLSSFAVVRDRLSAPAKVISGAMMGGMIADKATAEAELRDSDLDWTIVHATTLTDGPATATAHAVQDGVRVGLRDKISRADVASWLVTVTVGDLYRRQPVLITG